ncbi:MAG: hypothetical protein C0490_24665, partial [Marivirga sp.]|nr:hypothetical protein [Marivirga sp.]
MKSINISTKITFLILTVSLIAIAAISFFSYDHHLKTQQEKFTANLNVIADNRAAYFNTYFEKASIAVQILQNSETLKAGGSIGAPADGGADLMAMTGGDEAAGDTVLSSTSSDQGLSDLLTKQKYVLGVDEIILTSPTGTVLASTDPNVTGSFVDPDGVTFDRAKTSVYFSSVLRDKTSKKYLTYVAGVVTDNAGSQKLVIIKLDLTAAYKVLKNYQGLGQSGEVILARQDPISRKVALISPLRNDTTAAIQLRDPNEKFVSAFSSVFEGK